MEEKPVGIEARSNDYMDGISDMILLLQAADLNSSAGVKQLWETITSLEVSMNDIRQSRFLRENQLNRLIFPGHDNE
jgi:hypothetical protein